MQIVVNLYPVLDTKFQKKKIDFFKTISTYLSRPTPVNIQVLDLDIILWFVIPYKIFRSYNYSFYCDTESSLVISVGFVSDILDIFIYYIFTVKTISECNSRHQV